MSDSVPPKKTSVSSRLTAAKIEKTSDVIRRALRLLDQEAWQERARVDMRLLKTEDLSAEADAWDYDADGNIRITGTNLTVPARPADHA